MLSVNFSKFRKQSGCFIIGEVAQAHDGSLGMAHAFIDAISNTGADAVKFQTHIASAESTQKETWRVKFSLQDKTRYDYWKRMEFSEKQWLELKKHADEKGLYFLSTPFSHKAMEMLRRIGVAGWKIASGEVNNIPMLDEIIKTDLPIILSSGMSSLNELDKAVERIKTSGSDLTILQCTTAYPCPPEKIGLNMIPLFKKRYNCKVGLSDHSGTIYPALAAASQGIDVLEVHVTLSREMFGPDVSSSVTTAELKKIVEGVRFIEKINANPVDKNLIAKEMMPQRKLFTKSIVAKTMLKSGSILSEENLTVKKPGTGIPAEKLRKVLGRRLKRTIQANEIIREEDLEKVLDYATKNMRSGNGQTEL